MTKKPTALHDYVLVEPGPGVLDRRVRLLLAAQLGRVTVGTVYSRPVVLERFTATTKDERHAALHAALQKHNIDPHTHRRNG